MAEQSPTEAAAGADPAGVGFETRLIEVVFPALTNHYGTLFAGNALSLMAKSAFVTATRLCRQTVVLARADDCRFLKPVPQGRLVEMVGRVAEVTAKKIVVDVEMLAEVLTSGEQVVANRGRFVFATVDADGRAVPVAVAAASGS